MVQLLFDKGFDWVFETAFQQPQPSRSTMPVVVTTRRHDLTAAGAQGTSDVDIIVHHHLAQTRVPVILTFQKFNTQSEGTTFPMVLGGTAHLTLRRDNYLITALIAGGSK